MSSKYDDSLRLQDNPSECPRGILFGTTHINKTIQIRANGGVTRSDHSHPPNPNLAANLTAELPAMKPIPEPTGMAAKKIETAKLRLSSSKRSAMTVGAMQL